MFAGLLLSVVGGGAGLTLGISTVISNDLYVRMVHPRASEKRKLWVTRITIIMIIGLSVYALLGEQKVLMNELTYLSMGLRGAAIFMPLMGALFFNRWIKPWLGFGLLVVGAGTSILWFIFGDKGIDPVFPALVAELVLALIGVFIVGKRKVNRLN